MLRQFLQLNVYIMQYFYLVEKIDKINQSQHVFLEATPWQQTLYVFKVVSCMNNSMLVRVIIAGYFIGTV